METNTTDIKQTPELADQRFDELRDALNKCPELVTSNRELVERIRVLTNRTETRDRIRTTLKDLRMWQNRNPATAKADTLLTRLIPRFVANLLASVGIAPTYEQQRTEAQAALASPDNAVVGLDQAKAQLKTQKAQLEEIEQVLLKIAEYKKLPNEEINQEEGKKPLSPTHVGLVAKREWGPGGRLSFTLYLPDKTGAFTRKVSIEDVAPFLQRELIKFFADDGKPKKPMVLVQEHLFQPNEMAESSAGLSGLVGKTDWNHTQLVDIEFIGLEQVTTKEGQKIIQLPDGFRKVQLLSEAENITAYRDEDHKADYATSAAVLLTKAAKLGADEETIEVLLERLVDTFQKKVNEQIKDIQGSANFGVTWAGTSFPHTFEEVTDSLKALRILGAPDSDGEQAVIKILEEYAGDTHDHVDYRLELLDGVFDLKKIKSLIDYRAIFGRMEDKRVQARQLEASRRPASPEVMKRTKNVKVFVGDIGIYDGRSVRYVTIVSYTGEETTLRIPIGGDVKEDFKEFFGAQHLNEIQRMFDKEQGPFPAASWNMDCSFIERRKNAYRDELPPGMAEFQVDTTSNPDSVEYEDMAQATVTITDPEGIYDGPTVRLVTIVPDGGGPALTARISLDDNVYPDHIFDEKQLSRFDEQWLFDSMIQARDLDEWDTGRSISVKIVRTVGSSTLKLRPNVQKYVV